jgi:hypothetical protein
MALIVPLRQAQRTVVYNLCRIHKTLCMTPAMESNLTDHVWDVAELLK